MKLRHPLALVCMTCVTALASAATPKFVYVPADELTDAVELLAKQYAVDVIYPSELLRGRETQGLNGSFEAVDGFKKLLEGTPLVVSREGNALLITQSAWASQQATARDPADVRPEVLVVALRETAEASVQPKPEPVFGWARHDAERETARVVAEALHSKCERVARIGDRKIEIYCTVDASSVETARVPENPSGATTCRRLIKPGSNRIQSFCGNRALWEKFDIWAVDAKVTCRLAGTSQEICLTVAQWNSFNRPGVVSSGEPNWPRAPTPSESAAIVSGMLYSPTNPDRILVPQAPRH